MEHKTSNINRLNSGRNIKSWELQVSDSKFGYVTKNPKSEIPVHDNLVNILDEQNDHTNVDNQQSKI